MSEQKLPLVYIKDKKHIWYPATLDKTDGTNAHVTLHLYPDEQSIMSDGGRKAVNKGKKTEQRIIDLKLYDHKVLPLQNVDNNGNLIEYADMVELPYLHEAAILYNMKKRHIDGKPYTRTGDIIIAINPFRWINELYTEEQRNLYSNKLVWNKVISNDRDVRSQLEPHIYEVSALSYKGLAFDNENQSILVSGESGAGKTETVKIAMNHIACVQRGPVSSGRRSVTSTTIGLDPVVQRVVDSNPLLEAFGNAKTRRNDNSSRFGKYLQLQFDTSEASLMSYGTIESSKCKLVGSKCDVYLLEKNRIIEHDIQERTFHIFYQILSSSNIEKTKIWDELCNKTTSSFKYIGNSTTTSIEGMTDEQHYTNTIATLELINIKGNKLIEMMRAICAVMQCGNITFGECNHDKDHSEITSKEEVNKLAKLMGVNVNDLNLAFTERTMKTRTETYKVPLNASFAKDACDALAKELYGNIFLWLVREINNATCAELNYNKNNNMNDKNYGIIGLLDIFGFESFTINRFEQLCINYANEKLQQKFTEDIFRSVQKEYESEGICLAEISYDDNVDVLDLIEGRTGLLAMLNEECVRPKGNDFDFVQKALVQNNKSSCLLLNRTSRVSFGIHHYAGKVMYEAEGFVSSNQDTLPTDLSDLCLKSSNTIISNKVNDDDLSNIEVDSSSLLSTQPKRQKSNIVAPTVWGKYKTQLGSLMVNLRKTSSRYIRCIKPNMAKKPILMEHESTVEQLRCAGVVAAVTLSRSAFPNRINNSVIRFRFASQWDNNKYPSKANNNMSHDEKIAADCEAILLCALKCKDEIDAKGKVKHAFVVGKTKSYFRAGALEFLESNRLENGLDIPASKIQALARGFVTRNGMGKYQEEADAMKRKQQEEERLYREELARIAIEDKKRKEEIEIKKRQEIEAKARADAEEKKKQEEAIRMKKEQEEQERRAMEEANEVEKENMLLAKLEKLQKEFEQKKIDNSIKIKVANEKLQKLNDKKKQVQDNNDIMFQQLQSLPQEEIDLNQKKIDDSEKLIAYLRKENKKVNESIDKMKGDLSEREEENHRLLEANVTVGVSLDSLEKKNEHLLDYNIKLEDNLKKWKIQNKQLNADLKNRKAYYNAEIKIQYEYKNAMDNIISILQTKCSDTKVIQEALTLQQQVEQFNDLNSSHPGLESSDVSM